MIESIILALCLTEAMFEETRGETNPDAPLAVAQVILNRVEDDRYPDDICEVTSQDGQFQWYGASKNWSELNYLDEKRLQELSELSHSIVEEGFAFDTNATHFHASWMEDYPGWTNAFSLEGRVGDHLFYTNETPYP